MTQHTWPLWPLRRLLRLDKWTNFNLLNGWKKETISSRCGKAQLRALHARGEEGDEVWLITGAVVDFLFFWDGGVHCLKNIQYDCGRPAIPDWPDLRWH